MPTATVVVAFVDFLISFALLLLLMAWYRYPPDWRMLGLPGFVLLAFVASVGPALWITALNVKYRDFRYVIPFIVQFGLVYRRSGSARASCPASGGCFTPSTLWSVSLTASAGQSLDTIQVSTCLASAYPYLSLWDS